MQCARCYLLQFKGGFPLMAMNHSSLLFMVPLRNPWSKLTIRMLIMVNVWDVNDVSITRVIMAKYISYTVIFVNILSGE